MMSEKWLGDNESVIMDAKSFVWVRRPLKLSGTWAHIYLTNERLYVKNRLFKIKLLEFPYGEIRSIDKDEKYLIVSGNYKGEMYKLKIKQNKIDEMWESMIKRRAELYK